MNITMAAFSPLSFPDGRCIKQPNVFEDRCGTLCDRQKVETNTCAVSKSLNVKRNGTNYVDKYYIHRPNVLKFKSVKFARFITCILELF